MGTNKRAIVMGASSGMGREVARLLLAAWLQGVKVRSMNCVTNIRNSLCQNKLT